MSSDRFPIVYCDPPWEYNQRAKWAETSKFGGGATGHYNVTNDGDMANWRDQFHAMRPERGTPGVMLMWFVLPQIEEAYRLMRAWGYEPVKPIWFWHKLTENGKDFRGTGHYTFSNFEGVLLGHAAREGKRGNLIIDARLPIVASTKRCRYERQAHPHPRHIKTYTTGKLNGKQRSVITHSKKPDVFRDLAVELFGDLPRVEVFARERVSGWAAIGDQLAGGSPIEAGRIIRPLPAMLQVQHNVTVS